MRRVDKAALLKRQQKIIAALTDNWMSTGDIARAANLTDIQEVTNALVGLERKKVVELKSTPRAGQAGTHTRSWRKVVRPRVEDGAEVRVRAALLELEHDGLLGMLPDGQLAKAYGIPESRVRGRRITLEIKAFSHQLSG